MMWRFILPAFALLGLAFYELSGGADYAPVPGSLQAPLPDPEAGPAIAARDAPAEPADPGPDRVGATVISLAETPRPDPPAEAPGDDIGRGLAEPAPDTAEGPSPEPDTAPPAPGPDADLREISGENVSLHDGPGLLYGKLADLDRGTAVEVLESPGNGWLRLRVVATGTEGWIADWLVTADAN